MTQSFVLRAGERGHDVIHSEGSAASYVAGHPDSFISGDFSFGSGQYQSGRPGFGAVRVFGDETFHGAGCGYNMHPHHNFIICAFVLEGELTHVNTAGRGMVDQLRQGDYYRSSAGSGGKHCELSISPENTRVIYLARCQTSSMRRRPTCALISICARAGTASCSWFGTARGPCRSRRISAYRAW